jgi:hypothetical protein
VEQLKITITQKAFYLLYFSCYFALLFSALSLSVLIRIPEHLRNWFTGGVVAMVGLLHLFLVMRGWLPRVSRTNQPERATLRLGGLTIDVIPLNAELTFWRCILLAIAVLVWGWLILMLMELLWRTKSMLPAMILLLGGTLAMIVNYAEKKWSNNPR